MKSTISMEEWLSELGAVSLSDGMTSEEIQDRTQLSKSAVHKKLKQAFKLGRLSVGQRRVSRIDGRSTWVPCYKIIEPKNQRRKPQ